VHCAPGSATRSSRSSFRRAAVSVDDAVGSYLFNSQFLPRTDGKLVLVAPAECRENPSRRPVARHAPRASADRSASFSHSI
jgi:succinylarginine dihydrolase